MLAPVPRRCRTSLLRSNAYKLVQRRHVDACSVVPLIPTMREAASVAVQPRPRDPQVDARESRVVPALSTSLRSPVVASERQQRRYVSVTRITELQMATLLVFAALVASRAQRKPKPAAAAAAPPVVVAITIAVAVAMMAVVMMTLHSAAAKH